MVTVLFCEHQQTYEWTQQNIYCLYICFRFLATGSSFKSLEYSYRLGHRSVSRIVSEVCEAIWSRLQPREMPEPNAEQLKVAAEDFKKRWNYDHCFGALDGKHVEIKAPAKTGSAYFNYKKTFSIVLLALVDANYRFTMVDIGAKGRFSDGGIFSSSFIGERLREGCNLPPDEVLYEGGIKMPYVAVADEAFPLLKHVMRPYPGKTLNRERSIYNYRLSRARRVVENAFGILAARWRVFYKPFEISVQLVDKVVKACCVLHNFLLNTDDNVTMGNSLHEVQRSMQRLQVLPRKSSTEAFQVRDSFMSYFNSEHGQVPWQWEMV